MGYETKVILKAIIRILKSSNSLEEAIEAVIDIANAEGIVEQTKEEK